jgi:predicted outer membrane protein
MTFSQLTGLAGLVLLAGACTVQQLPPGQYPSNQYQGSAERPGQQPGTAPAQQQPPSGQAGLPPFVAPQGQQPGAQPPRITRTQEALSDPQIVGVVDSFYNARIRLATMAQSRANDPAVRSYASRSLQMNTSSRTQTQQFGIQPAQSELSNGINMLNQREIGALATQSGAGFDQGYLAREVVDNQHFVQLLDKTLIPSAKSVPLRAQLALLRPQYESDVRQATYLQQNLSTAGASAPQNRGGRATGGAPEPARPLPQEMRPMPQRQLPPPAQGNPRLPQPRPNQP